MSEVLSQAEIDNLLNALQSGELKAEDLQQAEVQHQPEMEKLQIRYRDYDFRRPNKFSEDQLRTLQVLHEGYARLLSSFLSSSLRANIVVRVSTVDQFTFDDFVSSVPSPTLLTVFSLPPLDGVAVIETNPMFLFPIIDLLFGGRGDMSDRVRVFTEIEISVIKKLIPKLLDQLIFSWKDFYEVTAELQNIEVNPRLVQVINPGEMIALLTFTTVIGGTSRGLLNLCLPHPLLEPVLSKLSVHYQSARNDVVGEYDLQRLEYWLGLAEVSLTAVTGETEITVRDFLQLQEGDVVTLDRRIDEDMDFYLEGKLKYKVQPGTQGRFMAVQVTSLTEGGVSIE